MSFKFITAIIITIALTVVIMQNSETVIFTIFSVPMVLPKLVMLTATSVGGFLLGVIITSSRKRNYIDQYRNDASDHTAYKQNDHLSDEDRDYIS